MVPIGCRITIISDSCHSGGLIEQAEEQIGDSTEGGDEEAPQEEARVKGRSLPFSTLIEILKQKSGKEEISRGELSSTLTEIFGEDSSLKVQEFIQQHREQREEGSAEFEECNAGDGKRGLPASGVLISGCQSDQTSADANPTGDPADAYGALSHAIQTILNETEGEISNTDLVAQIRDWMVGQGYGQEPGLYCSDKLADAPFIC